jgi:hypothetical protein
LRVAGRAFDGGHAPATRLSWAAKAGHPVDVAQELPAKRNPICETEQHELDGLFSQAMTDENADSERVSLG